MKNIRHTIFWSVVLLVLGASGWWIFYVPYRPDRVFEAIPASASVVTVHQNLAGEWDTAFKNPLLRRAIKAAGIDDGKLTALSTNHVVREWTEKLASDQTLLAYVPAMGTENKPALIAASWIGNQSRLLRWQMAWIKTRDLTPVYLDGGNLTIWLSREKFGKTNLRLSLALSEGLVLACISEDPIGVRTLLESAEKYPYRHTVSDLGKPAIAKKLLEGVPRHSGWVEVNHQQIALQLDIQPEALSLEMRGQKQFPAGANLQVAAGTSEALRLVGKRSDVALLLPLSWVSALIPDDPSILLLKNIKTLTDASNTPTNALAFVALLDQDHNGRIRGPINKNLRGLIKGVKAPTLLLGIQVKDDAEADKRINQSLAMLNSQFGLELSAGPYAPDGSLRMTSIQGKRNSFYGTFEPEECVAYTVRDNWLILASNGTILQKLLSQPSASGLNDWKLDGGLPPTAIAWANLNGVGLTLKNAAGVAKLATLLDSSEKSKTLRSQLDQAGIVASVLRELKEAKMTLQAGNNGFRLKLMIGDLP